MRTNAPTNATPTMAIHPPFGAKPSVRKMEPATMLPPTPSRRSPIRPYPPPFMATSASQPAPRPTTTATTIKSAVMIRTPLSLTRLLEIQHRRQSKSAVGKLEARHPPQPVDLFLDLIGGGQRRRQMHAAGGVEVLGSLEQFQVGDHHHQWIGKLVSGCSVEVGDHRSHHQLLLDVVLLL